MGFWDEVLIEAVNSAQKGKEVALNIATAGGRYKLKRVSEEYDSCWRAYESSKSSFEHSNRSFRNSFAKFNAEAEKTRDMLADARSFVERLSWNTTSSSLLELSNPEVLSMTIVDHVLSEINIAVESGKGAGLGAAAGVGAWMLVAHLGTASTGAAISGLAGAASTSAILAWFGGGALAAGGGGMALGGMVFGGLTVIPAVAYMAFRSYKEARRIEGEMQNLTDATSSNNKDAQNMCELVKKIDSLEAWISERNKVFSTQLQDFRDRSLRMAAEVAAMANAFAEEISTIQPASSNP